MAKDKNNAGVVSINGNVKNGLIYYSTPSPTGGLPDRSVMRCGGRKKAKFGDWLKESADAAEELNDNIADWLKQRRTNIRNIYSRGRNALEDLSETLFNADLTDDSPEVRRTNQRIKNVGRNLKRIGKNSIPGIVAEELIRRGYNEAQQMVNNGQGVYDSSADARDSQGNNPALGLYNLELPGVDTNNAGYNIPSINGEINLNYNDFYPNTTGTGMLTLPRRNNNTNVQQRAVEASRVALRGNALENNRPQYYAERNLPLFEDGAAINSGLVRAGWSHGNGQPNVSIDIPTMNVNLNRSYGTSPRRGSNNGVSSAPVRNDLPAVARPRTSLAVEANLDPGKIPASVAQAAHAQASGRQYGEYAGVTPRDWMSLAGNVAGSIGNWLATRNSPRITIAEPNRPFIEMPVRLKTNYNNRPQIANVEEQARRNYQNIRENTASSSAALARMQRVRNAATQNINELEAQRENIETQLTNADRANRQQVRARNARAMNQYYEDLASARTRQSIADAQRKSANQAALSNLFNNVNLSFQDFLGRMDRRESFNNTLAYLRAANPDYDDRMFKDNGANFINMYLQGLNELIRK